VSIGDDGEIPIIDIEVELKPAGLLAEEVYARTRQLATRLRELPHKTVGIASKQSSESAGNSVLTPTEGKIAMSLSAATLPEVIKVLRDVSGFVLKGPNGMTLDLDGHVSQDQMNVWLNTAAKQPVVQHGVERVTVTGASDQTALPSVEELRAHARHHIESGAVTEEYLANRQEVLSVLNQILATELVCILRYKSHYYNASGINSSSVKAEFLEHAKEAQLHADQIATRIVQLNGAPDFNPENLIKRSLSEFKTGSTLVEMIKEDLIAERIAVEFYSAIIRWLGDLDLTTRKVMQEILAVEVQHAEDMKMLLGRLLLDNRGPSH
jgi:bacterioferritin